MRRCNYISLWEHKKEKESMEKQRLKRILAFVLSLLMMFNSSGIMAYAEPNEGQDPGQQETRERIEFVGAESYDDTTGTLAYVSGNVVVKFSDGTNDEMIGDVVGNTNNIELYAPEGATGISIVLTPDEGYTADCILPGDYEVQRSTDDDTGVLTITGSLTGQTYVNGPLGVSPIFTEVNGNSQGSNGDPGNQGNDSLEGLCFIDWIDFDWGNDGPDYSTFRLGDDGEHTASYRNDKLYAAIHDERYILLATASQDGDDTVYTPVTSDSGIQKVIVTENGNVDALQYLTMEYVDDEDLPDGFEGLWKITANEPGEYKLLLNSESIDIEATLPEVGFYAAYTASANSYIYGDVVMFPTGYAAYVIPCWEEDDGSKASLNKLLIRVDGDEADTIITGFESTITFDGGEADVDQESGKVTISLDGTKGVWIRAEYELNGSTKGRDVHFSVSRTGLHYIDWIESDGDNWDDIWSDDPDYSSLRIGGNNNESPEELFHKDDLFIPVGERRLILLGNRDSENGSIVPLTDKYNPAVQTWSAADEEWVDSGSGFGLEHIGWSTTVPTCMGDNGDYFQGLWIVRADEEGSYRIAYGDSYINVEVGPDPLKLEGYSNSACTSMYERNEYGDVELINTNGLTFYVKAEADKDSGATPEILGYWQWDNEWWQDGVPQGYEEPGTNAQEGVTFTLNSNRDIATVKLSKNYNFSSDRDFIALAKYTYPLEAGQSEPRVEYRTLRFNINISRKGLVVMDWVDIEEWDENGPVWSTISPGSNADDHARYNKGFGREVGDEAYVLFAKNTKDTLDDDDYSGLTPVTSGLTVKTWASSSSGSSTLVATQDVELTYVGNKPGVPENCKGLWKVTFKPVKHTYDDYIYYGGSYSIVSADGTSVSAEAERPIVGMYTAKENDEGNYETNELLIGDAFVPGENYYVFEASHWGQPASYADIEVDICGTKYYYDSVYQEWYTINGLGREICSAPSEYLEISVPDNMTYNGQLLLRVKRGGFNIQVSNIKYQREDGSDEFWHGGDSYWFNFNESNKGLVANLSVQFDSQFPWGEKPLGTLESPNEYWKNHGFCYEWPVYFALGVNSTDERITDPSKQITRLNSLNGLKLYKGDTEVSFASAGFEYIGEYTYKLKANEAAVYRIEYTDNKGNVSSAILTAEDPLYGFYADNTCATKIDLDRSELSLREAADGKKVFFMKVPRLQDHTGDIKLFFNSEGIEKEFKIVDLEDNAVVNPDPGYMGYMAYGITISPMASSDPDYCVYQIMFEDWTDAQDNNKKHCITNTYYEFRLHAKSTIREDDQIEERHSVALDKAVVTDASVDVIIHSNGGDHPEPYEYSGSPIEPDTIRDDSSVVTISEDPNDTGALIDPSLFFVRDITGNDRPGTVNVTYEFDEGISNFTGSFTGQTTINHLSLDPTKFTVSANYSPITNGPKYTVTIANGEWYDHDVHFGYQNAEDTDPVHEVIGQSYYAKIDGRNNYGGTVWVPYTYEPYGITVANLLSSQNEKVTYDGTEKAVNPMIKAGETMLVKGTDFDVAYFVDENCNIPAGDLTNVTSDGPLYALVTCKGKYSGEMKIGLSIMPADLSKAVVKRKMESGTEVTFPIGIDYSELRDKGITPSVWLGEKQLTYGIDYFANIDIAVGKQNFVITGTGNYTGSITKPITIKADTTLNARTATVTVSGNYVYTGDVIVPDVTVKMSDGTELVNGTDYEVVATAVKAGRATAKINGLAEAGYTGSLTATYTIEKRDLSDVNISLNNNMFTYAVGGVTPAVSVKIGETELVQGTDYTVTYADNKVTGNAKAIVAVKTTGSLTGAAREIPFTIVEKKIDGTNADIAFVNTVKEYYAVNSGDYVAKQAEVLDGTTVLAENKDYTLTVEPKEGSANAGIDSNGNLKAGTKSEPAKYTFKFTGIGNYSGDYSIDAQVFAYNKTDIKTAEITGIDPEYVYTGSAITPAVTVKDGNKTLDSDDYTVTYENNVNVGSGANALAKINIIGKGDYEGSVTKTFKINPKEISDVGIAPQNGAYALVTNNAYVDSKNRVVATTFDVYYKWSDSNVETLTLNKDYTVVRQAVKAVDGYDVSVNITFKGNYKGVVNDIRIDGVIGQTYQNTVSVTGIRNLAYNGKDQIQRPTIKAHIRDNAGGEADLMLALNTDYTLSYYKLDEDGNPSGSKLEAVKDAGTYCMVVECKGKYSYAGETYLLDSDAKLYTFEVAPLKLVAGWAVLQKTVFDYTKGVAYEPEVIVTYNRSALTKGVDYDIDYTHNGKPGTGHAVITGKGNFTGEVIKDFAINGSIDITSDDNIEYHVDNQAYFSPERGGALPYVQVTYDGEELEFGKDYTVAGKNNTKIFAESGLYATLTITGKGKYKGSIKDISYKVIPCDLADYDLNKASISFGKAKYHAGDDKYHLAVVYTGTAQKVDPLLKIGNVTLKKDKDYTVKYYYYDEGAEVDSVLNAGLYAVEITGIGNYENTPATFCDVYVMPKQASKLAVTVKARDYTGDPIDNSVVAVKDGRTELREDIDYIVSYDRECVDALDDYWFERTGVKGYYAEDVAAIDNVLPGAHKAYIIGIGNYQGVKVQSYNINGYALSKVKFVADDVEIDPYTGQISASTPMFVEGTYAIDRTTTIGVDMGKDFDIVADGFDGTTGRKTATLQGKGRFTGTAKVTYNVKSTNLKDLADDAITVEFADPAVAQDTYIYAVNGVKPQVTVKLNGTEIPEINPAFDKANYTVVYANNRSVADKDALRAPKVTVRFTAYSGLVGNKEVTFNIVKADISDQTATIANVVSAVNAKTGYVNTYMASPVIKDADGTALRLNTHYTITYVYAEPTMVFDGKNLVQRSTNSEVKKNDKFKAGTKLRVVVSGKGMLEGATTLDYYVLAK